MRLICHCLLALSVVGVPWKPAVAAENATPDLRPIQASVTSPGAAVRSGPGESYYLTDTLPEETVVEVYRQQADGWCAIRPPADSFSWVFAQNVRLLDEGLAEISQEDVAARVGSRMSTQRDVVQVRLHQGEKVVLLGRDEHDGNKRDRGLWYKIAPPAGEFRWVRASDVGLASAQPEPVAQFQPVESGSYVTTAALEEPSGGDSAAIPASPAASANAAPGPAATSHASGSAAHSDSSLPDVTPIGPAAATSTNLTQQLNALELRLSRMVAESPTTWNTTSLEQAAELLLSRADTVADREAVKVTLAKIDRFAAIQRRYASTHGPANPTVASSLAGGGAGYPAGASAEPPAAAASPYDAVGILRPVVSRRPGAPQFALVNPEGQVVAFITPSPDVNLQPYVGQRIGVTGSRGYIPEFRRAHVTAARVMPLQERILR